MEPEEIELIGLEAQLVAGRPRQQQFAPAFPEDLAETRHLGLEVVGGALPGRLSPEPFDQEIARNDLVGVNEEHCQECALLRPAQLEQAVVGFDLERPKNPELHLLPPPGSESTLPRPIPLEKAALGRVTSLPA